MSGPWLHLSGKPVLPVVRQATATECGLACVAMIAAYLGAPTDLVKLRRHHEVSLKGATLENIVRVCTSLQLSTRAITCELRELGKLRTPCILHWRFNHFVVLKSVHDDHVVIHDPARGVVCEPLRLVSSSFTGVALEVAAAAGFQKSRQPLQLKISNLISSDVDLSQKFFAGLLLALICEVLILASPFYLQVVIDQVLSKGDRLLLNTLAAAFCLLLLFNVAANAMRQFTFQYLSHVAVFDITARVMRKLLRLPIRYFRVRELGDIQHRIQSLTRIQNFIVNSMPALVLDVLFVVLIIGLMTLYEPTLTFLMIVALGLWSAWRAAIFSTSLRLSADIAQAESSVQTHFLESLRAVQSIKAVNGESSRESQWCNLFANATNARIRMGNLHMVDAAIRQLLFQGARIVSIYLLARRALDGQLSIGMISAFVAYLGMFTTRACGIVDRVLEYKLLEVPLSRLSDIVFSEEESTAGVADKRSIGDIELINVTFSYSRDDAALLKNCCARIPEKGFTAIIGASGSGKSTLLQLIAGNEVPTRGELTFGGQPTRYWCRQALRSKMAVVFQDDTLLKGSVAENIALFDQDVDRERMRNAARDACIAGDIESLPMAYETRIGDLGSALSRGQVQRILLARAFYRQPQLLLLDEATSGLDSALEERVVDALINLQATKIVVTHSDLMLRAADEVLWLNEGRLSVGHPC